MKLVQNTQARLVIVRSPWTLAALVFAMGAGLCWAAVFWDPADGTWERWVVATIGAGLLGLAWWAFPFTHTVFDREAGIVVHRERRLTGARLETVPLADVDRAQVRSTRDESGGRSTRLVLILPDREMPLEKGFGPADRRIFEDAINDWLTRPLN